MSKFRFKICETQTGYFDIEAKDVEEAYEILDENWEDYFDGTHFTEVERDYDMLGEVKDGE